MTLAFILLCVFAIFSNSANCVDRNDSLLNKCKYQSAKNSLSEQQPLPEFRPMKPAENGSLKKNEKDQILKKCDLSLEKNKISTNQLVSSNEEKANQILEKYNSELKFFSSYYEKTVEQCRKYVKEYLENSRFNGGEFSLKIHNSSKISKKDIAFLEKEEELLKKPLTYYGYYLSGFNLHLAKLKAIEKEILEEVEKLGTGLQEAKRSDKFDDKSYLIVILRAEKNLSFAQCVAEKIKEIYLAKLKEISMIKEEYKKFEAKSFWILYIKINVEELRELKQQQSEIGSCLIF